MQNVPIMSRRALQSASEMFDEVSVERTRGKVDILLQYQIRVIPGSPGAYVVDQVQLSGGSAPRYGHSCICVEGIQVTWRRGKERLCMTKA